MKKILILIAMVLGVASCSTEKPVVHTPDSPAPSLTLTSESSLWFEAMGGEGVINYTLSNPANGVELEAYASVEWITDIVVGDNITFLVAKNDAEDQRRGTITVEYGDESISVSVMQREMFNVDVTFEAESLNGSSYFGKVENADIYRYNVMLSTKGVNQSGNLYPDDSYYIFDVYATAGAEGGVATLPVGEYTFGAEVVAGVVYSGNSEFIETSQSGREALFEDVRLIVSEGHIEAYVTLNNGEKHYVTYSGDLTIDPYKAENTDGYSTLRRDYSFDISGGVFVGAYVGSMYYSSADTCQVYLFEELDLETGEEFGDEFQLDLQLPRGETDICGTYTPGTTAGHFLIGTMEDLGGGQYMQTNTWYMTAGYLDFAPLVEGKIVVEKDENDVYIFTIDCIDDEGNKISGVFRGTGEFTEW